jgi:hypothetical protein
MKEFTSGADRIRTMNDAELSDAFVSFAIGLLDGIFADLGVTFNHNTEKYTALLTSKLQMPTKYKPKQYTAEEMVAMEEGTKVYIHHIGPCHGFYSDVTAPWYASEECIITATNEGISKLQMPLKFYDKSWVAYAYKPNDFEIDPPEKEATTR